RQSVTTTLHSSLQSMYLLIPKKIWLTGWEPGHQVFAQLNLPILHQRRTHLYAVMQPGERNLSHLERQRAITMRRRNPALSMTQPCIPDTQIMLPLHILDEDTARRRPL